MRKKKNRAIIAIVFASLLMVLVFYSSSMSYQAQSMTSTLHNWLPDQPFTEWLNAIEFQYGGQVVSVSSLGYAHFIEFFIRKMTHFLVYFLIAYNWSIGFRYYVKKRSLAYVMALLTTVLYATTDEFHQSFRPGRTALIQDVVLDSIGALCGTLIAFVKFK